MTTVDGRGAGPLIGPYLVLRTLGEGGMGVVYEAEETGSVRRRVALKVVRTGIDSDEVLARFEAERQALAVMNHPGIAKVLHADTTAAGQPYFAMELVKGPALTEYCDVRRLTVRERLALFADVCRAVQHAHLKGVIHRDLKPSNILVAEVDGRPQPKIIDFGIAKAVGQELASHAAVTRFGQAMGTIGYMSPEQAGATGFDVDTRADVYSLGAILYELLVGHLPVDPHRMGVSAFLARLAHDDAAPPRPSARFAALGDERVSVAYERRADPSRLHAELAGDLDWIALKAMDAQRARRYDTANDLALDVERFLASVPIVARPPTTRYRLGKFVRRNRGAVAGAAVAAAAVIAGATFTAVGMVRATRAERRAEAEAAAARQVTDFLVDLFRVSDPGDARGNAVTAREILDRGAARVQRDLAGQPQLQGRLMQTVGTVYGALGLYEPARRLLEDALRLAERAAPREDSTVAALLDGVALVAGEKGDFADADRYYERALAVRRTLGEGDAALAPTLVRLAGLRTRQGRAAEAESLYARVLAVTADPAPDAPAGEEAVRETRRATALMGLAVVRWSGGQYDAAEPLMREALAIQERRFGRDHPDVAATLNNLGALAWTRGRYADALPLYRRAHTLLERALGPDHVDVASALTNLGETYWKLGRHAEAEPLFRRALAAKERALAPGHPAIAVTLNGLAGLLRDGGRTAEAESLYRRALAIRERAFGVDDPAVAETVRDLGTLLRGAGRAAEAAALEARLP